MPKVNDSYKINVGASFLPLEKAIIIKDSNVFIDNKHHETYIEIENISELITEEETAIKSFQEKLFNLPIDSDTNPVENSLTPIQEISPETIKLVAPNDIQPGLLKEERELIAAEIIKRRAKIELLLRSKNNLFLKIKDFDSATIIDSASTTISKADSEILRLGTELKTTEVKHNELKALPTPDELQKVELTNSTQTINDIKLKIKDFENKKVESQKLVDDLKQPLIEKYTKDISELHKHIYGLIQIPLMNFLPKIVYWEHGAKYILQSETLFTELLNKTSLEDISRPLVNVFRIGLYIHTIEELKEKIIEIQIDPGERSRYEATLNEKINKYIKKVWCDYDQDLKISLEKDQIRIQIFDPSKNGASFYNMEDRSQGCKTFLSFLLTIGVEAEHGVIKNTILLLDEPETHLHPSGVRFMLQELIKISEKGNLVIYATHSIFLIDRNKFDRHVILKKEKENTTIKPSNVGRIGYFMQEEVLYGTLDFNLKNDFSSTNEYNFVFEGDGDVILFEHFYDKILSKDANRPYQLKSTSFHQGGKCSDIQKYLTNRPIQLGTKWVFILDKDNAGDGLKKFIEGKYKNYLNSDIFVFQYDNKGKKSKEIELEDLFAPQFIIETYLETAKQLTCSIDEIALKKLVTEDDNYITYNDSIISDHIIGERKSEFKGKFKEIFNTKIKLSCEGNKNEVSFKKIFPEYYKWVTEVTAKLNSCNKA
ncbi:MAG: AAA family ATPase [Minisyncoccia bacterium]